MSGGETVNIDDYVRDNDGVVDWGALNTWKVAAILAGHRDELVGELTPLDLNAADHAICSAEIYRKMHRAEVPSL